MCRLQRVCRRFAAKLRVRAELRRWLLRPCFEAWARYRALPSPPGEPLTPVDLSALGAGRVVLRDWRKLFKAALVIQMGLGKKRARARLAVARAVKAASDRDEALRAARAMMGRVPIVSHRPLAPSHPLSPWPPRRLACGDGPCPFWPLLTLCPRSLWPLPPVDLDLPLRQEAPDRTAVASWLPDDVSTGRPAGRKDLASLRRPVGVMELSRTARTAFWLDT